METNHNRLGITVVPLVHQVILEFIKSLSSTFHWPLALNKTQKDKENIMEYNTSELCNTYADLIDVVDPIFCNYGGRSSFGGQVVTIKCFENNGLILQVVAENGQGKVLVVDGGGSTRRALIDINIASNINILCNISILFCFIYPNRS